MIQMVFSIIIMIDNKSSSSNSVWMEAGIESKWKKSFCLFLREKPIRIYVPTFVQDL